MDLDVLPHRDVRAAAAPARRDLGDGVELIRRQDAPRDLDALHVLHVRQLRVEAHPQPERPKLLRGELPRAVARNVGRQTGNRLVLQPASLVGQVRLRASRPGATRPGSCRRLLSPFPTCQVKNYRDVRTVGCRTHARLRVFMPPSAELPPPPKTPSCPPKFESPAKRSCLSHRRRSSHRRARAFPAQRRARRRAVPPPSALRGHVQQRHRGVGRQADARAGRRRASAWLRLNYRGVGRSEGRYDAATREVLDVLAAFAETRYRSPQAKVGVMGYSFGAGGGVPRRGARRAHRKDLPGRADAAHDARSDREYTGPLQIVAAGTTSSRRVGRNEGARAEDWERRCTSSTGADHFFVRYRREVAGVVLRFFAPELSP